MSDDEWHDITRYNLIMSQKSVIKLYNIKSTTSGSSQNNSHFVHFVIAPSDGESNSFSTIRTSLVTGRFKIWLGPPFLSATRSVTLRTSFFPSTSIPTVLAIGHWFQWQSSLSKTISPTAKFRILFFHICLTCRLWRNSFLHLLQNSLEKCCTRRHHLFEYASGLLNSLGSPGASNRSI